MRIQRLGSGLGIVCLVGGLIACDKSASEPGSDRSEASHPAHGEHTDDGHAGHASQGTNLQGANMQPAPADPGLKRVFFVFPQDGSKLTPLSSVKFGVEGMALSPAGEAVEDQSRGHHHLIIDAGPVPAGQPVPMDAAHLHFGKAQEMSSITLTPGHHALTLQFADGAHISYGPLLSASIQVDVVASSEKPAVQFLAPRDGEKVSSPVKLRFGISGMSVRPAGEDVLDKTSGHHHLIVDGGPIPLGQVVPKGDQHIHYGQGQTEAEISLSKGSHSLTMQLADGAHASYGPELSQTITIEVQ